MTNNPTQQNENDWRAQTQISAPPKQGLYDPQFEHDACGLGFVVDMKGRKSHQLVSDALQILVNLDHRGAVGCEPNTGDGAGILIQVLLPCDPEIRNASFSWPSGPNAGSGGSVHTWMPVTNPQYSAGR